MKCVQASNILLPSAVKCTKVREQLLLIIDHKLLRLFFSLLCADDDFFTIFGVNNPDLLGFFRIILLGHRFCCHVELCDVRESSTANPLPFIASNAEL